MTEISERLAPAPVGQELIDRASESSNDVGVNRIDDPAEMGRCVTQYWMSTRRELCSVLPAGPYPIEVLRSSWEEDSAMVARGIDAKAIYRADAVQSPEILRYLSELAAIGAQIRVSRNLNHRMIIFDRRAVLVAVKPDTLDLPYLLVTEPALVRSFSNEFASGWRVAHSVGIAPEDVLEFDRIKETLQILASGVTDEYAARQLGVSDRTIRRRVAAVLDLLGASSRFEAGVKAAEAGWL